jgi:hypothetical protein
MKRLLLLALLPLAGCAITKVKETYSADGEKAYMIRCDGGANNMGNCYAKAGEICSSKGYDTLYVNGEVTPFGTASGFANSSAAVLTANSGAFHTRTIFVQCKGAPASN